MIQKPEITELEEMADEYGLVSLIPASNTIIVKEAGESPIQDELEWYALSHENVNLTWTENTAEITVS